MKQDQISTVFEYYSIPCINTHISQYEQLNNARAKLCGAILAKIGEKTCSFDPVDAVCGTNRIGWVAFCTYIVYTRYLHQVGIVIVVHPIVLMRFTHFHMCLLAGKRGVRMIVHLFPV